MSPAKINWAETIAIFGGRFDPPHLGHFEAVRGLFGVPGVKQVWILPSPTPPHKPAVASKEHREEMARLGLMNAGPPGDSQAIRLDLREFERARARPEPTYTYDTLQEIRGETRNIAFVIGTDQLEQFRSWYRFPEVLGLSHWIVLGRRPEGLDLGRNILRDWESSGLVEKTSQADLWSIAGNPTCLTLLPTQAPPLSSTQIREQLARTGKPPEGALQPSVLAYLKLNSLYGMGNGSS